MIGDHKSYRVREENFLPYPSPDNALFGGQGAMWFYSSLKVFMLRKSVPLTEYFVLVYTTQVLLARADWLGDYSTNHLRAAEEKQNGFPFRFDFRKGNSFNERGGCTEKHKHDNKVWCNSI